MNKVLFLKKLILKYTDLVFLRKVFALLAKALAIVAVVMGVIEFIDRCSHVGSNAEQIIAWIIMQLMWLIVIVFWFHIWWMKGDEIGGLKDTDYVMTPVAMRYIKAVGESIAVQAIFMGVAAMFMAFFMNNAYLRPPWFDLIFQISTQSGFLWGLVLLANAILYGIIVLGIAYLASSLLAIYLEIARNTRKK